MGFNVGPVIVEKQQTVSDTALSLEDFTGISAAQVENSNSLLLVVNSGAVRFFYGGTTPTTSTGNKIDASSFNVSFWLPGLDNLKNFQIIRDDTTDAEVVVTLEG